MVVNITDADKVKNPQDKRSLTEITGFFFGLSSFQEEKKTAIFLNAQNADYFGALKTQLIWTVYPQVFYPCCLPP